MFSSITINFGDAIVVRFEIDYTMFSIVLGIFDRFLLWLVIRLLLFLLRPKTTNISHSTECTIKTVTKHLVRFRSELFFRYGFTRILFYSPNFQISATRIELQDMKIQNEPIYQKINIIVKWCF